MQRSMTPLFATIALAVACSGTQGAGTGQEQDAPTSAAAGQSGTTADDDATAPEANDDDAPDAGGAQPGPVPSPGGPASPASSHSAEPVPPAPVPSDDTLIDAPADDDFAADCEREIEFQAVELSDPAPFDVIIVADHSDSLSWSRDDLSEGLSQLLTNVRGADARFYVLTPTQYDQSSSQAIDRITGNELVNWSNPVTGEAYQNAMTEYSEVCTDDAGAEFACPDYPVINVGAFTLDGEWTFQMPEPVAQITREMSEQELAAQQAAIRDAILSLSGSGSLQEQPLCTLNRYLTQPSNALPQHAIFVVLSDEDDITTPGDCLTAYHYERTEHDNHTIQIGCTSNCDGYRYRALAPRPGYELQYRCTPVDDQGVAYPDEAVEGTLSTNSSEDCTEVTTSECRSTDISRVQDECGSDVMIDCSLVCTPDASDTACFLELDQDIDCSTSFEYEGTQYANLLEYCTERWQTDNWDSCEQIDGYWVLGDSTSYGGSESMTTIAPGSQTTDLVNSFRAAADKAFAAGSYYVEVIGFDPKFACEPKDGQSYATTLATLASSPEDVFPICESYAPALARVESFAGTLLETEYSFQLSELEEVESVRVTDTGGQERTLADDEFDYDTTTQTLALDPNAISPSDVSLTVQVARNCVPKAR
jgi:hypothetical protein